MELGTLDIDIWWNLLQDILEKDVHGLFHEHKVNEASYEMKLKAHEEVYPKFVYEFPSITLEYSFIRSNMDRFQASTHEEIDEVQ